MSLGCGGNVAAFGGGCIGGGGGGNGPFAAITGWFVSFGSVTRPAVVASSFVVTSGPVVSLVSVLCCCVSMVDAGFEGRVCCCGMFVGGRIPGGSGS